VLQAVVKRMLFSLRSFLSNCSSLSVSLYHDMLKAHIYSAMVRVRPSLVNGTGLLTGIMILLSQLNECNS